MADGVRVICDMYVVLAAVIVAVFVFRGAQCEKDNDPLDRPLRRRAPDEDHQPVPVEVRNRPVHENEEDSNDGKRNAHRPLKLADEPACAADVSRICGKLTGQNNFAVIECLQNDLLKDEEISEACQHFVWSYKHNLTMDFRFDAAATEICLTTLNLITECSVLPEGRGLKIPCLIENIDNVTNNNCKAFLKRMESIVFSDYRLIYKFADKCRSDIDSLQCGRLTPNDDSSSLHNQGRTLSCLAEHLDKLANDCKQELLRVAELQADDYHKDRQLYYACREDRENFCHKVKAGDGRIYKCLFRHKFDPQMSDGCLKMLTLRQQLQQEDYRVNMKLARSCQNDILINNCLPQIEDVAGFKNARLSAILLCLEGAMKDGKDVNPDCTGELKEVRRSLMEDYQISPVLVRDCSKEIQEHCGGGLHRDGKTIHCLMDLARPKKQHRNNEESRWEIQISDKCVRALEDVLEEADVGDNYEVDPAIQEDCEPVVRVLCKDIRPGEGRIMNCLVESLDKPHMTDLCRERLMEIYFFITRDFRLDSRLYKQCRSDAKKICQAPENWYLPSAGKDAYTPPMKQLVFACLYRHLVQVTSDPSYVPISRPCSFEVKRVMRERALSVDLDPQVADVCLVDLGLLCSDKTLKAEEMECLEDNLESLRPECKKVISEYAKAADVAPELNDIFQISCSTFWNKYCPQAIQNDFNKRKEENQLEPDDDDDDNDGNDAADDEKSDEIGENLMACLIRYKSHPSMDDKCRAGIEHHQLITAKDYSFSHHFSQACRADIATKCPLPKDNTKKAYVVQCLSEHVRNDTFSDAKHRISKACRKQLKFELLQRGSNIKLDPDLEEACREDVDTKCKDINPGKGAVIQCLRKNQKDLSDKCRKLIFKREQEEAQLPMTDYLLMSKCKSMIKRYCVEEMSSPETIFECLQRNKDETNFDKGCFDAIIAREELRAKDIRLNPILEKNCMSDVQKFCLAELHNRVADKENDGHVLACLRRAFAKKRLSETCEEHIREVIIESAKDYRQDLELVKACSEEIQSNCLEFVSDTHKIDNGKVEDCLKEVFEKKKIPPSSKCYNEVVRIIEESEVEIHSDVRLYKACSVDLKQHCGDIIRGEGRQMSCLIAILKNKKIPLDEKCNKTLSQRIQLWSKVSGDDGAVGFQQIANNIVASPSRNYFVGVILVCIGIIFIGGLFCGRVTKRIRREIKDR